MTHLTPVVLLHENIKRSDYEYLFDCMPQRVPLVLFGESSHMEEFHECFQEELEKINTVFVDNSLDTVYEHFYQAIQSPFWTIATPYEVWAENFFEHTQQSLSTIHYNTTDLLYFIGFVSNGTQAIQYAQLANPQLAKPLSLHQLFDSALWFSPFVKIVFATSVCKEIKVLPRIGSSSFVSQHILTVEYLSALYSINNFTEPNVQYFPSPFLSPTIPEPTKQELTEVRLAIMQREEVWQRTLWSKTYWKSLYFFKKYEHLLKS